MTHDDILDALGYVAKIHLDMQSTPSMNLWRSEYMGEWVDHRLHKETAKLILNTFKDVSDNDNRSNREKENKTMENDHALMNKLKKGMYVKSTQINRNGTIKAFDYVHNLVGVCLDNMPDSAKFVWCRPSTLLVICEAHNYTPSYSCPKPKRVIYDEAAGVTVVLWEDGQKTIVRVAEGEQMDAYDAFCAAYCKRVYGSNSALKRELNRVLVTKKAKEEPNETH